MHAYSISCAITVFDQSLLGYMLNESGWLHLLKQNLRNSDQSHKKIASPEIAFYCLFLLYFLSSLLILSFLIFSMDHQGLPGTSLVSRKEANKPKGFHQDLFIKQGTIHQTATNVEFSPQFLQRSKQSYLSSQISFYIWRTKIQNLKTSVLSHF